MKTKPLILLIAALLPATVFAAQDGKRRPKSAAPHGGPAAEVFKTFDKNENQQIDADELPALQQAFATLKRLDRNDNGEIELSEVERPLSGAGGDGKNRMREHFKKIDGNGNRRIDADEVEALEKMASGSPLMSRLDQNGDGKLAADEVERLNSRLKRGRAGTGAAPPATAPSVPKTPEKPAGSPTPEAKKEEKPAAPPEPPGNFGV